MSDPMTDKLRRLTPDAGRLDRDELLFRAGRASVPRGRFWMLLSLTLAASQAVTLWWFTRPEPTAPVSPRPQAESVESVEPWPDADGPVLPPLPTGQTDFIKARPPLTAGSYREFE